MAEGEGENVDLSAELIETKILVTLGTDGDELLDDTKNTAELVAAEIDEIDGFSAEFSGTGATAFDAAIEEEDFSGGLDATQTTEAIALFIDGDIWATKSPVGKYDEDKWQKYEIAD